ncbi:hypothetical protein MPTK1_5g23550 [Marchantia polymorpha subsp. ruderalis]|uniref:Uncharacterized protein n=2 Tax=Marchantia polymorpha TaxID=3197 RepID=A0AAF6BLI2_MARPO|nr:hypothetical protein MARPO_0010s0101 [Marchantia polymorpha]BBN12866.1 hypothetical protein Mp_5g23550 [Marchantia polymorpha subsp. ruderalis]PTQ46708.1 hypothetical protein MARPO_0010s0101 [Marchantia polymorpha]PTQ46709.1 hypothetical protein MARPO_0010s0101 [Marchantia polymorpha]BBN12867.1 hypothetical protein Mp_5g23550 [Marchantia polymorpha subsp. ruderalis]|eukprot:PTQ46707.1 hypothetical protein MARPO_0010s0101 [Marchantia polymorpha]
MVSQKFITNLQFVCFWTTRTCGTTITTHKVSASVTRFKCSELWEDEEYLSFIFTCSFKVLCLHVQRADLASILEIWLWSYTASGSKETDISLSNTTAPKINFLSQLCYLE